MTFESYKFSNKVFVKDTQQRIMLTLGSVAGKLSKNGRGQEAHEITQRIHEMLGMHGKIWKNHKLREGIECLIVRESNEMTKSASFCLYSFFG